MKSRKSKPINTKQQIQDPEKQKTYLISLEKDKSCLEKTEIAVSTSTLVNTQSNSNSKTSKSGKSLNKKTRETIKERHSKPKKAQKMKTNELSLDAECPSSIIGEEYCNEYCVVDERFVLMSSSDEKKWLQSFVSRAETTINHLTSLDSALNVKEYKQQNPQLSKNSNSSQKQKRYQSEKTIKISRNQQHITVSNLQPESSHEYMENEVPEHDQMRIQYSERQMINIQESVHYQRVRSSTEVIPNHQLTESQEEAEQRQRAIFRWLHSNYWQKLNKQRDPLINLGFQPSQQKRQPDRQRLQTKQQQGKANQNMRRILVNKIMRTQEDIASMPKGNIQLSQDQKSVSPPTHINFDSLKQLISLRQRKQLCQNQIESSPTGLVTGLQSIDVFLDNLFRYIQQDHSQDFIERISCHYGSSYQEKYQQVTRNLPMENQNDQKYKVIRESVFQDFIADADLSMFKELPHNRKEYVISNYRAIFDAANEYLSIYQPYYDTNGQTFPWTFRPYMALMHYQFNEDQFPTLLILVKEALDEMAAHLCGILVQYNAYLPQKNPLQAKRLQNQEKEVMSWLKKEDWEKDKVQLFSTYVLHKASQQIFEQLIQQLVRTIV